MKNDRAAAEFSKKGRRVMLRVDSIEYAITASGSSEPLREFLKRQPAHVLVPGPGDKRAD